VRRGARGGAPRRPNSIESIADMNSQSTRRRLRTERGQSMAEFALLAPLFLFVIFIAITFAVIGLDALAVGQLAYQGARYAAVNPQLSAQQVQDYIESGVIGSPTITANNGAALTVTVQPASGFGQPVTVTVAYDLSGNSMVSMMSKLFKGLGFDQQFPTTLSATEAAMSE
jgi:Flp pilus assembly protein TadG